MTKRIDVATMPVITGTRYPAPFDETCRAGIETVSASRRLTNPG